MADELAVPAFLRKDHEEDGDGGKKDPPTAGLDLRGWAAEDGRFYVSLYDIAKKRTLVTIRSHQPGGF